MSEAQPPRLDLPPPHAAGPDRDHQQRARRARLVVYALIAAVLLVGLGMRVAGGGLDALRTSATIYVGLPAVLAAAITASGDARSAQGATFKGITVVLLLLATLWTEGIVCVLIAAPLAWGLGAAITGVRAGRRGEQRLAVALLPLALLSLEGATPATTVDRLEIVTASAWVDAAPDEVRQRLLAGMPMDADDLAVVRAGMPEPVGSEDVVAEVGDRRRVRVGDAEAEFEVSALDADRIAFRLVSDDTMITRWITWRDADLRWVPEGAGTRVDLTVRFERRMDPAWWFGPASRVIVGSAADAMLDGLASP